MYFCVGFPSFISLYIYKHVFMVTFASGLSPFLSLSPENDMIMWSGCHDDSLTGGESQRRRMHCLSVCAVVPRTNIPG